MLLSIIYLNCFSSKLGKQVSTDPVCHQTLYITIKQITYNYKIYEMNQLDNLTRLQIQQQLFVKYFYKIFLVAGRLTN